MGLFISRELAELQGGMIGVASNQSQGSESPSPPRSSSHRPNDRIPGTFGLYIKAKRATASELVGHHPAAKKAANRRHSLPQKPAIPRSISQPINTRPKYSILLVEDNIINQRVLSSQLRKSGCTVHIANHGLEALDFVQKTRFWQANSGIGEDLTVILMDWEMPICDGLTCTRRLRDMERQGLLTESLKIVAITSNARPEQVDMAIGAGMVGIRSNNDPSQRRIADNSEGQVPGKAIHSRSSPPDDRVVLAMISQ